MAYIVGETVVSVDTNKGKIFFPVFHLDVDVAVGVYFSVSKMSDGVTNWYPFATARSVLASPSRVYTSFESNGHALKGVIENNNFYIRVYNEQNQLVTSDMYGALSANRCCTLDYGLFIGANGVPCFSGLTDDYNFNPSSELPVFYTANTNDSFGSYARPNFTGLLSITPNQENIDVGVAILRDSSYYIADPYAGGGNSDVGGGTGDFDITSDPIDFPALPTLGAVDSGFITLFNPTLTELKNLATYMWTNPLFDISAWKKVFADPMDAIIGLSIIPVSVPESGTAYIKVGNLLTDISAHVASAQFIEIQCGSINVNEFWGAYLDYDPYTKAEIYLPYCGTHQLSVDEIMGKTIEVRYHVDILSGACCAYVKCGDSVLYSFIGQCASSVPISGSDFTNVINGVLSAATAIGSLVATGGASAPLSVPQLASTSANALKPNVEKSGALSGTGGILGIQKPYLILSRPRQALPENQNQYTGYPSFITSALGDLSGYTEIEQIHLHDIPATGEEIAEIERLLKTGVIL